MRGTPTPFMRAVAEAEAAARQADAAEHGGERDRHPVGLLAVMRALQRPRAGDEAAHVRRRGARDRGSSSAGTPQIAGGPFGGLGDAVVVAQQIALRSGRSRCSSARGIPRRDAARSPACAPSRASAPCRCSAGSESIARRGMPGRPIERAHHDEFDARLLGAAQPGLQHMRAGAAGGDLRVLQRQAAERDDQLGCG